MTAQLIFEVQLQSTHYVIRKLHCAPQKNRLGYSWISCTVVSLLQWQLACDILMILAIECIHNLPPHLSCFYTTWYYTKTENLCCLPLSSVSGAEKNRFRCVWSDCEPVVCLDSKWRSFAKFAFTRARSRVCHWLRRWCREKYGTRCQWAFDSARQCRVSVLCNVR